MTNTFTPGPTPNTVRAADGKVLAVPDGWILLRPGDAALTRRVKATGDHWVVAEKKGRKVFSRGIWASAATIERIRGDLDAERSTEDFAKKKEADARRREKAQVEYVGDFLGVVVTFLGFHAKYADLADRLARAVTDHATPVGSGTVARTKRIPVEQRAEAAVIAWMRHSTTGYDSMVIPRVRGKRREVRRMLARRSHELLERYRAGAPVGDECPLKRALNMPTTPKAELLDFLRRSESVAFLWHSCGEPVANFTSSSAGSYHQPCSSTNSWKVRFRIAVAAGVASGGQPIQIDLEVTPKIQHLAEARRGLRWRPVHVNVREHDGRRYNEQNNSLHLWLIAKEPGRQVFFKVGEASVLLAFRAKATIKGDHLPAHGAKGPGHFALGIAADALDAWRQKLQESGVAVEKEVEWPKGGKSIYFRDPAGNLVELITPGVWGLRSGW